MTEEFQNNSELPKRNLFELKLRENIVELTVTATSNQMAEYFYDLIQKVMLEGMRVQLEEDLENS